MSLFVFKNKNICSLYWIESSCDGEPSLSLLNEILSINHALGGQSRPSAPFTAPRGTFPPSGHPFSLCRKETEALSVTKIEAMIEGWLATLWLRRPITLRARPVTSSPTLYPRNQPIRLQGVSRFTPWTDYVYEPMIFAARFVCACVHACVRAYVQIADEETRRAQWCHPSCSLLPFLPPFLLVTRDSLSLAFPIYARSCLFTLAHWYTLYSPLDSPSPQSSLFGVPFHSWCLAADIIYMTNVADLRRKRRSRASSASRACA